MCIRDRSTGGCASWDGSGGSGSMHFPGFRSIATQTPSSGPFARVLHVGRRERLGSGVVFRECPQESVYSERMPAGESGEVSAKTRLPRREHSMSWWRSRRSLIVWIPILLVISAAAFWRISSGQSAPRRIVVILPSSTNPFWIDVHRANLAKTSFTPVRK